MMKRILFPLLMALSPAVLADAHPPFTNTPSTRYTRLFSR